MQIHNTPKNPEILVSVKNIYGNELIYPECYLATKFAKLTNRKTLTRDSIKIIQEMGYTINVITPSIEDYHE